MEKSTISMAIFNSYVSLPEGSLKDISIYITTTIFYMWMCRRRYSGTPQGGFNIISRLHCNPMGGNQDHELEYGDTKYPTGFSPDLIWKGHIYIYTYRYIYI